MILGPDHEHRSDSTNAHSSKRTTHNRMLTGKPMKVLRVATLPCSIFQQPCLGCLNKHLAIPTDLISWITWSISSHTFPLVLTTLVTYFGLRLGDKIGVPKELTAQ